MISKKNLLLNFMMFFILFLPMITVQTQASKNIVTIYGFPAFNIKDDTMIQISNPSAIKVRNTTDISDFSEANDDYGIGINPVTTYMVYPYWFGNHLFIPAVNSSGDHIMMLKIFDCTNMYPPELLGYCLLNNTWWDYLYNEFNWELKHQLILQENYVFFHMRDADNDNRVQIINVTDVTNPIKSNYYSPSYDIFDFEIYENTMLLAVDDINNIRLVNITDKSDLIAINNNYSVPYTYSCSLEVKDHLLFVYDDSSIYVYDLSDIPVLNLLYKIETIELDDIKKIIFYNDYLISIHHQQISIYDLTDPSNTTISEFTFEYEGLHSFYFGQVDNNRLYISMLSEYQEYTLAIYDLTNITEPKLLYPQKITSPIPIEISTIFSSIVLTSIVIYYQKKRKR